MNDANKNIHSCLPGDSAIISVCSSVKRISISIVSAICLALLSVVPGPLSTQTVNASSTRVRNRFTRSSTNWLVNGIACLIITAGAPATASTVIEVIDHGQVPLDDTSVSYGAYENSLFFNRGSKLYRLDSLSTEPVEVALPTPPGTELEWTGALNAEFTTYDGALFFHALRVPSEDGVGARSLLHRISSRYGQPEIIDVPEEPATSDYNWVDDRRGYADDTGEFAEFEGKLYFFARRALFDRSGPYDLDLHHGLFRLNSAESTPQQIDWLDYATKFQQDPGNLTATDQGLLFYTYNSVNNDEIRGNGRLHQIKTPMVIENLNLAESPESTGFSIVTEDLLGGPVIFNSSIFYTDTLKSGHQNSNPPDIGPFPIPGDTDSSEFLVQIELYRYNSKSGIVYYDLNPLTPEQAQKERDNYSLFDPPFSAGSSNPSNFMVANGIFYFSTEYDPFGVSREPDGDRNEWDLYRMTSASATPELLSFSPNPTSVDHRVFGEFGGRTWLWTDTGTGPQLHYLSHNGLNAVPVQLPNSEIASINGLIEYRDYLIFTARGEFDDEYRMPMWTYAIKLGDQHPHPLSTSLLANGARYPVPPGLHLQVGTRVRLRCDVKNNTESQMDRVHVRLIAGMKRGGGGKNTRGSSKRIRRSKCQFDTVVSGETRSCSLSIRVAPGTRKYTCASREKRTRKTAPSKSSVFVTGRRGKGSRPKE